MTTGQIQAPSSFDLWWEKQRKSITTLMTIVLVCVLAYYGWKLYSRMRIDAAWSGFAVNSGLQAGYGEPGGLAQILPQNPRFIDYYLGQIPEELVTKLAAHVGRVDDKAFDEAIASAQGTDRAPLLLWLAANKSIEQRAYDRAESLLRQLKEKHPNHFLCLESDYPPQFRRDLNAPEPGATPDAKPPTPDLAQPVKGSVVSLALAQIAEDKAFAAENPKLYTAPEPDSAKTATVKTDYGEFKIRFYETAAKKHVDTFLQLAADHHFDNMAIDQIKRAPGAGDQGQTSVEELHFGLVATKTEQDRSKWDAERAELEKDVTAVDFEDSKISHFPFMVAATVGKDGKSLPGRVLINVNDASSLDGQRVVFGRVVEGQDVVRRLVLDPVFATEDERQRGTGSPRDTIRIQSVTVE